MLEQINHTKAEGQLLLGLCYFKTVSRKVCTGCLRTSMQTLRSQIPRGEYIKESPKTEPVRGTIFDKNTKNKVCRKGTTVLWVFLCPLSEESGCEEFGFQKIWNASVHALCHTGAECHFLVWSSIFLVLVVSILGRLVLETDDGWSCSPIMSHACSIGDISGDFAGQINMPTLCIARFVTTVIRCVWYNHVSAPTVTENCSFDHSSRCKSIGRLRSTGILLTNTRPSLTPRQNLLSSENTTNLPSVLQ
ncbi:hypothetical protein TNCV_1980601 [Trichonephila clavipes]|nr:hypothetical protein TNCV_1980601 [Trichonephila clavipes]